MLGLHEGAGNYEINIKKLCDYKIIWEEFLSLYEKLNNFRSAEMKFETLTCTNETWGETKDKSWILGIGKPLFNKAGVF